LPTTIAAGFTQLKQNLEISGLQKSVVSTRHTSVKNALAKEMDILNSFLAGSYPRHTMISPLAESDVDLFIILDSSYYSQFTPKNLLDKVRRELLKTYNKSPKVSRNGQAVTITFTDFVVDVVPCFNRRGGGNLICDSINDDWISTDPKSHASYISDQNLNHNGDLVPLIKMIKGWMENPETFGHRFRKVSDSDSDFHRTVIPESFGHFRSIDRNNI